PNSSRRILMSPTVYQTINPATGDVLKSYPTLENDQVEAVVQQSKKAFAAWGQLGVEERAAKVVRLAELFEENAGELAAIMTKEMGEPIDEAREETEFWAQLFRYYPTPAPQLTADQQVNEDDETVSIIQRRPVGPLLGIMPWNYPYYQIARF